MRNAWLVVMLCGCGMAEETLRADEGDDLTEQLQELASRSPGDRIIVWQQNIEAMKASAVPAFRLTNAMLGYPYRPDIVVLQEAWQENVCGNYLDPAAQTDAEVGNWKQSPSENGLASGCRLGRAPLAGSVYARLGTALWGGVGNVGQRRPFSNTLGRHSRTGTVIAWDARRFTLEGSFEYDDADVPGCPDTLASYQRTAVLLRDNRRTADTSDDVRIAVASAHYGSACMSANNTWVAAEMTRRWGTRLVRIFGGDFNARVDETSVTYAARRAELQKGAWYRAVLAAGFVDPIKVKHPELCSEWTYPNVSWCAAKTACADTCSGFGIGGKLDRLDYLFVSGAKSIISAGTDDVSAVYSDHKAVRVSIEL